MKYALVSAHHCNGAFAVIYHRYNGGEWLMPYLAVRDLDLQLLIVRDREGGRYGC